MTEQAEIEIVRDFNPLILPSSTTVMAAAKQMRSRNARAVIVAEGDGKLAGIFTERDAFSRVLAEGKDPAATTLAEVMTYNPENVTRQSTTAEVTRLMKAAQCRHLPIVDGDKAVGIVSRGDFAT
jgi:CBS domain-containing protein